MASVVELVEQARKLSVADRKELIKRLVDLLDEDPTASPPRSLRELRGTGKHLWADTTVTEYLDEIRNDWDNRQ